MFSWPDRKGGNRAGPETYRILCLGDGFNIAKGNLLCVIDADLSHPPEIIPKLIEELTVNNNDMVVASRYVKEGKTEGWAEIRRALSFLSTVLIRPLTQVKDPLSGFFVFKKEIIDDINLVPRGYKILLEILVKGSFN